MIQLNELKRIAANKKLALGVVEKDYALTWILYGLANTEFKKHFIFKGGTALRKIYFPEWRYSEDLDFSVSSKFSDAQLKEVIEAIDKYTRDRAGINLLIRSLHSNPEYAQIKIQFIGSLNSRNTIKVDISFNELIVLSPANKQIHSEYSDMEKRNLFVYPLEEILAEKIRSIIQRAKTRDYYDVWQLLKFHNNKINMKLLHEVLIKKCHVKNIDFKKDHLFNAERINLAQKYWEKALAHQITNLPEFNVVVNECKYLINKFLRI